MNTWAKIKNNIYQDKLNEIESLFNVKESHAKWGAELLSWTYRQKFNKYDSLSLSLGECNEVGKNLQRINEELFYELKNEQVVCQFKEEFKKYYKILLEQKEQDLKLEVVAELVEEKHVPLGIFVEWYQLNKDLPPQQFQEALGEFWGDVWKHAKHGAGTGALGGAAAGGLGGIGTFAGAGIGGLLGGAAGGLYGGGKHLLRKVWDWRKNKTEFDKTKKDAYQILKKLKSDSSQFELDPNFHQLLDTMIQKLGATQAYKIKQDPAASAAIPQVAATGGSQSFNASPPTNIVHQSNTGGVPSSHVADVGMGIHDLPGGGGVPKSTPPKAKEPEVVVPPPEKAPVVPPEAPKTVEPVEKPIESKEDVLEYLHKPGLDEKELNNRLVKLGLALNLVGDPQDREDYESINFKLLRHGLMHDIDEVSDEEKEHYKQKALAYQNFLAKASTEEKPKTKPIPNQPSSYVSESDPANMSIADFKEYLKSKGMWQDDMKSRQLGKPGSDRRLQFISDNGVTESVVEKYKKFLRQEKRPMFFEHKIGSITFEDRIKLYKEALNGRL